MSPTTNNTAAAELAYPPTAHAAPDRASFEAQEAGPAGPISTQPAAGPAMSLNPADEQTKAERVRGGCFPLPVCSLSSWFENVS
jgi:hypothetical protein